MDKAELIIALLKCIGRDSTMDDCCGCPLEDTKGCAYDLKLAAVKTILGEEEEQE